ncbi:MAG: tRNA pseudouridine(38-40) synthase TruA [Micrococcales bacterium]|nr:tRNA pseudouridine(38-40) synthase TruA [Micrococcales bacterium]
MRLRLDLAYDGTAFHGWAKQPGLRTVQDVLEQAIAKVSGVPAQLTVAGRTDAGVHARGQVCHFDMKETAAAKVVGRSGRLVEVALETRLRGVLPPDIHVKVASQVPEDFDARFSALWRRYCYRLVDQPAVADPLQRAYQWLAPGPLDESTMEMAGQGLLGTHDFAAYCRPREGATTIRRLQECSVQRCGPGRLEIWLQADAFCHNQVRAIVGALVIVGQGKRPTDWPGQVLARGLRDSAVPVVPAHGLTLEHVEYPQNDQLAAQAAAARSRR